MAETLRLIIQLPIFAPPGDPNTTRHSSTELRFSRWNNANAEKFNQRRRSIQEIEDQIRRTRRFDTAENIANTAVAESSTSYAAAAGETFKSFGTPSAPSRPSIPGKKSKYSKPPPKPSVESHSAIRLTNGSEPRTAVVNRFQPGPADVKIGDDGVSYIVDGAPFEFKYSYTETPAEKPVKLREQLFAPFGPATMPRPWTGRPPLPPCKMKLKEFGSCVKPVQSPGPLLEGSGPRHVQSREEILGEPLTKDEITELVGSTMKTTRQLNIGRDGLTHNMLETIHTHWMRWRVCKIKCRGVCTVDMDNVCQQLEERTWGKIIYRKGGVVYLFRGRNYDYKTRPRFPLMLWKPVPPVYPRLIKRVPEGLTLGKATKMRQKGRDLMPICKLAKNDAYCDLVTNVREAFEECELVRINCQGLNASDYRRIGAKLKDLVPCVLLSFEDDHILMWRGQNWKSSLPSLEDDADEANKINVNSENSNTLPLDAQESLAPCLQKNSIEHLSDGSHEITVSSSSDSVSLHEAEVPCPTENSNLLASMVSDAASLPMKTHEVETIEHVAASGNTSPSVPETSGNSINGMVDPRTDNLQDGFGAADVGRPSRSGEPEPCTKGVLLLLQQAVENGSALVIDDTSLDDDHIYKTTVAFAKSAPPEPVFRLPRKIFFRKSDKQEDLILETKETSLVRIKGEKMEESSKIRRKEDLNEGCMNVVRVPQRTTKVDKLALLK